MSTVFCIFFRNFYFTETYKPNYRSDVGNMIFTVKQLSFCSTHIVPLCFSTIYLTLFNPKP